MKKSIVLFLLLGFSISAFSQHIKRLNGYNYITIGPYSEEQNDPYDIIPIIKGVFKNKGYGYYPYKSESLPLELKNNSCQLLLCSIESTGHINAWSASLEIILNFYDCNGELVYTTKSKGPGLYSSYIGYCQKAVKKALRNFELMQYRYNPTFTPELILPEVDKTDETEASLTKYFQSEALDDIEGIYKSYQSDNVGYYKMGIKKYGNHYKAIILESENHWKSGEVKAIFEQSSMKGFYSTKWYRADKSSVQTFSLMESPFLLSVEFDNRNSGTKRKTTFIKMYPKIDNISSTSGENLKGTGSGFVLSTDGIIATNAHVVSDSKEIEITINNEIGSVTYEASVLLKDESNDVALLKIEDEDFKGFSTIPYSINTSTEIGEDVFTIGYPLNNLMGDNIKVTNGIVSSNSGFKDDVRFIQITAPIQPGNSGGPLFNKDGNIIGLTTSKLNENVVGTSIENVNYAIKATYLSNLYNMLPNSEKILASNSVQGKELKDQVKVLKNYICLINVY